MNEINLYITTTRFEQRQIKRSKYKDKKWYIFLAYTTPFCYIFYLLEKLKLVHQRPWRFVQTEVIVFNNYK